MTYPLPMHFPWNYEISRDQWGDAKPWLNSQHTDYVVEFIYGERIVVWLNDQDIAVLFKLTFVGSENVTQG